MDNEELKQQLLTRLDSLEKSVLMAKMQLNGSAGKLSTDIRIALCIDAVCLGKFMTHDWTQPC